MSPQNVCSPDKYKRKDSPLQKDSIYLTAMNQLQLTSLQTLLKDNRNKTKPLDLDDQILNTRHQPT